MKNIKSLIKLPFYLIRETLLLSFLLPVAFISRYRKKLIDIGLGPQPLINNIYHKKALEKQGYSVETFTFKPYYITNKFDVVLSEKYNLSNYWESFKAQLHLVLIPFKYNILYIYFNGGPLGAMPLFLWKIEPFLYKLANVKTVIMPYGSDVQDMSRSQNLDFKNAIAIDYPDHRLRRKRIEQKIDLWTTHANHIISGCEWVDYMYHWDTLMLAHFSIDIEIPTEKNTPAPIFKKQTTFKILHAPNHRAIKGTKFLIDAVSRLKEEGLDIELIMLERAPNEEVIKLIQEVDIVADQFIIGWYAMFAIEAMKHRKPVLCYLRQDLIDLYTGENLIEKNEIPIINTHRSDIKENIRHLYENKKDLSQIGKKSREYVIKHHSIEYIGKVFAEINKGLIEK